MKRIITLGLIVILGFALLTGCNGNNGSEDTGNNAGTAGETANNADNAANNATPDTNVTPVVSPPAWLIGEWTPADPVLDNQDISVTDNNVVFNSGMLDIEWQVKNAGLVVEESLDGDTYTLSYEAGGVVTTYIFKNQGNNAMLLQFGMGGNLSDMDFVKK